MLYDPSFWRLVETVKLVMYPPVEANEVFIGINDQYARLDESHWVGIKGGKTVRIDPPHAGGQKHYHLFARNGSEIGVINVDGSGSHGTKMRLSKRDAEALRSIGVQVKLNRIVEWHRLSDDHPAMTILCG